MIKKSFANSYYFRQFLWSSLLLISLFHIITFAIYPAPFVDEAWMLARTWSFRSNGFVFGTFDSGVFDRLPGHQHFFPWLPNFFWYLASLLQEAPALFPIRVVSLVFGFILLSSIYYCALRLAEKESALLAVVLLAFSIPFCFSAHIVRFDIIAAVFAYGALAFQLRNVELRFIPSLSSGLLLGLACEAHLHAAVLIPAYVVIPLLTHCSLQIKIRALSGSAIGLLLAAIVYYSLHVWPDLAAYFVLQNVAFAPTHLPPILSANLSVIVEALASLSIVLSNSHILPWLVFPLATIALFRDASGKKIFWLTLIATLSFALLIRTKMLSYYILIEPLFCIFLGKAIFNAAANWRNSQVYLKALAICLGLLCLLNVIRTISQVDRTQLLAFEKTNEQLAKIIKSDDVLMGPQTHWFRFYNNKFYSWENLIFYRRYMPTASLESAFLQFKPDIFIAGPPFTQYLFDRASSSNDFLYISKKEFESILTKYSPTRFDIPAKEGYPALTVYRFVWQK